MDVAIFLAAMGISILEMTEASAIAVIFYGIYHTSKSYLYAVAGVATSLIPALIAGKFLVLIPLDYIAIVAAVILFYFSQKLFRSARRSIKGTRRKKEEKEEGLITVYTVSVVEGLEASLVVVGLMPFGYFSALSGVGVAVFAVIALTYAMKERVMKIRVPQLKLFLSALLATIGTFWLLEVGLGLSEIFTIPIFLFYILLTQVLVRI
ncbi:hypothetical protein [Sulfuracidifex tepidarius]|uniref:Uncharacterized protein n=1 Tax=Sulfuracidifex tepidarius TaxID=1294262 RepID=A0A510DXJ1_9CREN|nr:hypothetical protein [Sulfuracidifex tepidarius]BBG24700.1 hypothetical protein IC006_2034 [Sulfuracidifex tepidarius]BBG27488.1 hypothetical protein IC007_2042 [Sulfuracidifex tepidarius]